MKSGRLTFLDKVQAKDKGEGKRAVPVPSQGSKRAFIGAETEQWKRDWWVGEAKKQGWKIKPLILHLLTQHLGDPKR